MINLDTVTLTCVDTKNIYQALMAINHSCKEIKFKRILFFTNREKLEISAFTNLVSQLEIIKIPTITNKVDYGEFCLKSLPGYIDTEFCLSIQHDGFVINPQSWTDEFLSYDYIGAPWPEEWGYINRVGNGGFCLKSKKFLSATKKIFKDSHLDTNKHINDISENEDFLSCIVYLNEMKNLGIKFAPVEIAAKFSVEHPVREMVDRPFGFHDKFTELSKTALRKNQWIN